MIRKVFNYSKSMIVWILKVKWCLTSILIIFFSALLIFRILSFYPEIFSAVFTITGIVIIFYQQWQDAKTFPERTYTLRRWIKEMPKWKSIKIASTSLGGITFSGKAKTRIGVPAQATLEQKVEWLVQQAERVQDLFEIHADKVDKLDNKIEIKATELKAYTHEMCTSLEDSLVEHAVGSYQVNILGLVLTLFGTLIQIFVVGNK